MPQSQPEPGDAAPGDPTVIAPAPDGGTCVLAADCLSGHCSAGFCCAAGDCCRGAADCPASYGGAPSCADRGPSTDCQGSRQVASCTNFVCAQSHVDDDSGCLGAARSCPNHLTAVACTAAVSQPLATCPATCLSDGQCEIGFACVSGSCVAVPEPESCYATPPSLPATPSTQPVILSGRSLRDAEGDFNALGTTLFWATWGYKYDRARLEQNLDFLAKNGFHYIRVLGTVGGDFWADRTMDPHWSDYDAVIAGLTDLAFDKYGLRVQWTIFGGVDFTPTESERRALVDRFLAMSRGREHKIILFEVANEAWQNGFGGDDGIAELRCLSRRMKDHTGILVAPSAYGAGEAFCRLYAGGVADLATMHFDRDNDFGDGVWRPVRQPWGYPGELPCADIPAVAFNNEPIGPYSSVAEEREPLRLVMAAVVTYVAGLPAYTLHTGAGVTGGGAGDAARGRPANLWEVERMEEITTGMQVILAALPAGLPSWSRHNAHWASYPFIANVEQFVRAYAATSGGSSIAAPIGMLNPVTLSAKSAMELDALDPLTGAVLAHYSLAAGQSFTLPAADAVLLRAPGDGRPIAVAGGDTLAPDRSLSVDQARVSADRRFRLVYQSDGNLVLNQAGAGPLWASDTAGTSPGRVLMQLDGNLVIYDAANAPVWDSGTAGHDGARLVLQNDGNVVIYGPDGQALWATGTAGH